MATVKLGQKVRDRITGITGIVTARSEYLYGCTRIAIQPKGTDDAGKPIEAYFTDEPQVEVLGDDFVADAEASRASAPETGRHGTRGDMQRARDITR